MTKMTQVAKDTLKAAGVSQAAWARRFFLDGKWHGDVCGCPDDRCVGYHCDDDGYACGCLRSLLTDSL